jgi:hypothetical protein
MADTPRVIRWKDYIFGGRLRCPCNHSFPTKVEINDTGFIRCDHWIASERRECGRWIFLLAVRGGGAIVAEVTLDDKAAMRKLSTPAQMLDYLGLFNG